MPHLCYLLRYIASLLICLQVCAGLAYGQVPARCHGKEKVNHAPKYRIGWVAGYSVKGPKALAVAISINPRHFTREEMTALARQLGQDLCNEQRIVVSILDDYQAAKHYDLSNEKTWPKLRLRGYYELDRDTGKEVIHFSLKRGNPVDEVTINLKTSPT
jgi:hypothetical protein